MKNITLLIILLLLSSCQSTGYNCYCNDKNLSESFIIDDRYYHEDKIPVFNSIQELIHYYKSLTGKYLPAYSSMSDEYEMKIASVEYLLSRDSNLNTLNSTQRKELLSIVLSQHEKKFHEKYIATQAKSTGVYLLIKLLEKSDARESLSQLCEYCNANLFEKMINGNILMINLIYF